MDAVFGRCNENGESQESLRLVSEKPNLWAHARKEECRSRTSVVSKTFLNAVVGFTAYLKANGCGAFEVSKRASASRVCEEKKTRRHALCSPRMTDICTFPSGTSDSSCVLGFRSLMSGFTSGIVSVTSGVVLSRTTTRALNKSESTAIILIEPKSLDYLCPPNARTRPRRFLKIRSRIPPPPRHVNTPVQNGYWHREHDHEEEKCIADVPSGIRN